MYLNIIKTYRDVIAICDAELLGKVFEQGDFQLDVKESFFKGDIVSEEKAIKIMQDMIQEDATFNIIGEKSVSAALKSGIISEEVIKKIQGIPFALKLL
ncbi:MAG: DUF424 family protein [Nanoarchaeota archaeon]|nr:DUF424 family protein [Nanoarchaeota archaeon]MBU4116342.1 DUF424 family protein [Nanoarchaeota archaeon]